MSKLLLLSKDAKGSNVFCERAINADPLNVSALIQQANIRLKELQLDLASESITSALSLDPRSTKALHLQQRIFLKKLDFSFF